MDKGYYYKITGQKDIYVIVAIHNKNGQGLLPKKMPSSCNWT